MVVTANRAPEPTAHCLAMGGSPLPVTNLAVNIQTKAVGTWKRSPGISYTLQAVSHFPDRFLRKVGWRDELYVELVYEGAHDSAYRCADDLAPELRLWRGAEKVAGFQVLHELAGLKRTLYARLAHHPANIRVSGGTYSFGL